MKFLLLSQEVTSNIWYFYRNQGTTEASQRFKTEGDGPDLAHLLVY